MADTRTWTVLELINWSKAYLEEKGFDNARLEVELLLGHVLKLPRIELYLQFERQLKEKELATFKALFKRRLSGEPVQYVTGSAGFMLGDYEVNPAVLIPRPETEALTEVALRMLREMRERLGGAGGEVAGAAASTGAAGPAAGGFRPVVADVGTGSGVIAATIAAKVPDAVVYATDVSKAALEVAARNAERAGVAARVTFLEGEMLHPLHGNGLAGKVMALVSNPPYIPTGDLAGLPSEVRDFEPREALDGGEDGLECLRVLVQDGPELLAPGGFIALEVGDGQASSIAGMLRDRLGNAEIHRDYAGRDRIVTGFREL
ncbi:MAG: peptide chain release factor N(5)-glutamine methyltransferase [Candidatus Eisenbacteria bacterium]|nr:peptide chain release factor N(5)-glutamine methyltransferase [Candidatus Eisenbacteria bacterium]